MIKYANITDLPPNVRQVLDISLQEVWLSAYQTAYDLVSDEPQSSQIAWTKVLRTAFPDQVVSVPQSVAASDPMMYSIDLAAISLGEIKEDTPVWIQAMPLGKYMHPLHGELDFNSESVKQFADNVNNKVRDQDLDIDYDHKAVTGEASGWVVQAKAKLDDADPRKNGLWLAVKWTADAISKIKNKSYRYFSPEFVKTWTHPKTNIQHSNVLLGGALTNRPFLKDILPVNLSEVITESGGSMDRAKMIELLGLKDDATDADIETAVNTLKNSDAPEPDGEPEPDGGDKPTEPAPEPTLVSASEPDAALIKLAEINPAVKAMLDERAENNKRLMALEIANRQQSVSIKLTEITKSDDNKVVMAPAVLDKAKQLALKIPVNLSEDFYALVTDLTKQSLVQLGETGRSNPSGEADVVKSFTDKIDALVATGMEYRDAAGKIALDEPALYEAYGNAIALKESV